MLLCSKYYTPILLKQNCVQPLEQSDCSTIGKPYFPIIWIKKPHLEILKVNNMLEIKKYK